MAKARTLWVSRVPHVNDYPYGIHKTKQSAQACVRGLQGDCWAYQHSCKGDFEDLTGLKLKAGEIAKVELRRIDK